jgi:hypothetical protein
MASWFHEKSTLVSGQVPVWRGGAVMCGLCGIFENFHFCARARTQVHIGAHRRKNVGKLCGFVRLETPRRKVQENSMKPPIPRLRDGSKSWEGERPREPL